MTQRERFSSSAVSEPVVRPAAVQPHSPRTGAAAEPPRDTAGSWETHFHSISPGHQQELLSLAEQQGVLYAHQLPPITNGICLDPIRGLLPEIFAGRLDHLEAIWPSQIAVVDTELDEMQRDAVRLALDTPDIALIQGLPGTGKSRVAAEVLTQAVLRGWRVLFVGSSAAGIDHVLARIAGRSELCPLRCLDRDERLETLPPAIRRISFPERLRQLTEHVAQAARRDREEAEQRRDRVRQDEAVLARLRPMAERATQLAEQLGSLAAQEGRLTEQIEHTAAEVEAGRTPSAADGFAEAIAKALSQRGQDRQRINAQLAELPANVSLKQQELTGVERQIQQVAPLADAKSANRWWSTDWWRATLQGNVSATLEDLKARQFQVTTALAELEDQRQRLIQEQTAAEEKYREQRVNLIGNEIARQREKLQAAQAELRQESQSLQESAQTFQRELQPPTPAMTVEAIAVAQDACRCRRDEEDQRASFAREWVSGLEKHRAALPGWIISRANIVAARWHTLANDEQFGPGSPAGRGFDLLVVEEAHLLTESEFLQLARRAKRWVLIGEPAPAASLPAREKSGRRKDAPSRPAILPFGPLWNNLHCDPRHLPYAWSLEAGRWCCRLRTLTPEQEDQLESENVADCPEIELRILAQPHRSPVLAEVLFPPVMTIFQAKQYIFRELQELPVQVERPAFCWSDEPDRIVVRLSDVPTTGAEIVPLYNGVREIVAVHPEANGKENNGKPTAHNGVRTCSLEFDRSAGWDRHGAAEWLARHVGIRDPGRTALLDVSYRMTPELAHFISGLLAPSAYRDVRSAVPPNYTGAVQFIAVPTANEGEHHPPRETASTRQQNGPRIATPSRPRVGRGGAGLEMDLADPRQRERLPIALRSVVPDHGLVNYTEAQAVIVALEKLARDGVLTEKAAGPTVAVTSTYPGQVALIRSMVRNSPVLSRFAASVVVDEPAAFRHREYPLVILSLTRSHSHRAVSYGPDLQTLILGLTRAVSRLILVGDPGTLIRRTQWEGSLDHLDEWASLRERNLLQHLARHLPIELVVEQHGRRRRQRLVSSHPALGFPGGRTLAAWWRHLADRQPQAMWAGHLLLHHLEALVERTEQRRPDPIDLLILKVLLIFPGGGLDRLDQSLHMGPQLLRQVLRGLERDGLVQQKATGWNVTPLGNQALTSGEYPRHVEERRRFYFRATAAERPPHFLDLHRAGTEPWKPAAGWSFDPQLLQSAVAKTALWKEAHGFPLDVEKVVAQKAPPMHHLIPSAWKRVILDRPERLPAVLIQTAGEDGEQLLAFGLRQENWSLATDEPVMTLGTVWPEVFPELTQPASDAECRQAWQDWCQAHQLGERAAETSALAVQGHLLQVTGSPALQTACSDAIRDEPWLLIGTGLIRRAALLRLVVGSAS